MSEDKKLNSKCFPNQSKLLNLLLCICSWFLKWRRLYLQCQVVKLVTLTPTHIESVTSCTNPLHRIDAVFDDSGDLKILGQMNMIFFAPLLWRHQIGPEAEVISLTFPSTSWHHPKRWRKYTIPYSMTITSPSSNAVIKLSLLFTKPS